MKKVMLCLAVLALLVAGAGDLFAGSIDYLTNQSAPWARNFSRNAVNDSADAVNYNPAGTAVMKEGLYVQANNQSVMKTYSQEVTGGDKYESTEPTYFLPSAFGVYKMESLSVFVAFTVPAGGGTLKYEDGIALFDTSTLPLAGEVEVSSMYLAGTLGVGYAVNDMLSLSLGGRYIKADKAAKIHLDSPFVGDVDLEQSASGFGGIIGINLEMKDMNIGLRYETATKLDFETTVNEDDSAGQIFGLVPIPPDGEKARKDLPALMGLGIDYAINPEMKAGLSFNYYFITQADQGDDDLYNDEYDNGWEAAVGFEYKVIPELVASISYMYSVMGSNEDTVSDFEIVLNSQSVGFGATYTAMEGLDITLGIALSMYESTENASGTIEYGRDSKLIALGVDYKAM